MELLIEVLGNMCIAIVYFSGYDVINFENNLSTQVVFFASREIFFKEMMNQ